MKVKAVFRTGAELTLLKKSPKHSANVSYSDTRFIPLLQEIWVAEANG